MVLVNVTNDDGETLDVWWFVMMKALGVMFGRSCCLVQYNGPWYDIGLWFDDED